MTLNGDSNPLLTQINHKLVRKRPWLTKFFLEWTIQQKQPFQSKDRVCVCCGLDTILSISFCVVKSGLSVTDWLHVNTLWFTSHCVCVHICGRAAFVCMSVWIFMHMSASLSAWVWMYVCVCVSVCLLACACVCACVYVCECVWICVCVSPRVSACVSVCL